MTSLSISKGRWQISLHWLKAGDDLIVILQGGDTPHLGCVLLGVPRLSLKGDGSISSTISTLNVTGHKDDEVARPFLHSLVCALNKNISLSCGLHLDDATAEEIAQVKEAVANLKEQMLAVFNK